MRHLKLLLAIPVSLIFIGSGYSLLSSGGKAGSTGSPGEGTCTQCHNSFDLNSGAGQLALNSTALEAVNWEFEAGVTYDLEFDIQHEGAALFGFGIEALDMTGADAGTLIISNASETKLMNAKVGGVDRTNLVHIKDAGLADNEKNFPFQWQAPDNIDTVTFYMVANAADANGSTSNDYIYTISKTITKKKVSTQITEETKTFTISPNPVTSTITISGLEESLSTVLIYDLSGRIVQKENLNSFNVSTLKKGNYIMVVSDLNQNVIGKQLFSKE